MNTEVKELTTKALATPTLRIMAMLLDFSFVLILCRVFFLPIFYPQNWDKLSLNEIVFSLTPLYLIFLFLFLGKDCLKGTSLGRWFFKIEVRRALPEFPAASALGYFYRNIFLIILPLEFYKLVFADRYRRIGDLVIGTVVIMKDSTFVVRDLSKRVIAMMLIAATFWSLNYISAPLLVQKSSYYQQAIDSLHSDSRLLALSDDVSVDYLADLYQTDSGKILSLRLEQRDKNFIGTWHFNAADEIVDITLTEQ